MSSVGRSRRDALAAELERLRALGGAGEAELRAAVVAALRDRRCHVVALAARLAADRELRHLDEDLDAAFTRFLTDPVKRDPGCAAKSAIATAWRATSCGSIELQRRGARYRQLEPSWGPPVDTAGGLRSTCAFTLVERSDPDVLQVLADLLADTEAPCRAAAARAIAAHGHRTAGPALLRFKLRVGDPEPEVLGDCMDALMDLVPRDGGPLLEELLFGDDPVRSECAALSLGASRQPEALGVLQAWFARSVDARSRRVALVAVGLHRTDASVQWLLEITAREHPDDALGALEALEIHRHDPEISGRVRAAAAANPAPRVGRAATERFAEQ